jgi:hypothetical protein
LESVYHFEEFKFNRNKLIINGNSLRVYDRLYKNLKNINLVYKGNKWSVESKNEIDLDSIGINIEIVDYIDFCITEKSNCLVIIYKEKSTKKSFITFINSSLKCVIKYELKFELNKLDSELGMSLSGVVKKDDCILKNNTEIFYFEILVNKDQTITFSFFSSPVEISSIKLKSNYLFLNENNKCVKLFNLNVIQTFLKPIFIFENEMILNFEISSDASYVIIVDSKHLLKLFYVKNSMMVGCLPLYYSVKNVYTYVDNNILIKFSNGNLARILILNENNRNFESINEEFVYFYLNWLITVDLLFLSHSSFIFDITVLDQQSGALKDPQSLKDRLFSLF